MYDLMVIGGGVNGVGIARDAAGRGLKTLLCEKDDLAHHTSSSSSKLIHGGLRYLEQYEFRLVRESLKEREKLLAIAPHIIWPMRIVLPVLKGMRPAWLIRMGLFLYDNLISRSVLEGTSKLALRKTLQGKPLKTELITGFEYSDCWADDARLVVLNAIDARNRGADILTRTQCIALERLKDTWKVTLRNANGIETEHETKMLVNAAGPWVDEVAGLAGSKSNSAGVRLVKGSHIVTKKLYEGKHGYIFQSADGRVIFAMPYEDEYTLIGTTDVDMESVHDPVNISDEETQYLCDAVNDYFDKPIAPDDVVWNYAGVRPLYDDNSSEASVVTRDYMFDLNDGGDTHAPILSIYGGKLTTFRKLAEHAMKKMAPHLGNIGESWTAQTPLPGGDFKYSERQKHYDAFKSAYPFLSEAQANRIFEAYGTTANDIMGDAKTADDLGQNFGGGLYEAEIRHLVENEFALTAEDILWRRTKCGLRVSKDDEAAIEQWLKNQHCTPAATNKSRRKEEVHTL